jgi:hypothetical protein
MSTLLTIRCFDGVLGSRVSATAQPVSHTSGKPKSAQGQKLPMRHDQLTLYPHGRPARRQSADGYTRHRFDQPTPIHNIFMGLSTVVERGLPGLNVYIIHVWVY